MQLMKLSAISTRMSGDAHEKSASDPWTWESAEGKTAGAKLCIMQRKEALSVISILGGAWTNHLGVGKVFLSWKAALDHRILHFFFSIPGVCRSLLNILPPLQN